MAPLARMVTLKGTASPIRGCTRQRRPPTASAHDKELPMFGRTTLGTLHTAIWARRCSPGRTTRS